MDTVGFRLSYDSRITAIFTTGIRDRGYGKGPDASSQKDDETLWKKRLKELDLQIEIATVISMGLGISHVTYVGV